jgi:hypothetical protein
MACEIEAMGDETCGGSSSVDGLLTALGASIKRVARPCLQACLRAPELAAMPVGSLSRTIKLGPVGGETRSSPARVFEMGPVTTRKQTERVNSGQTGSHRTLPGPFQTEGDVAGALWF